MIDQMKSMVVSTLVALMTLTTSAAASPVSDMLSGKWKGMGTAYLNILGDISVSCELMASPKGQSLVIKGLCRKGPFSRRLDMTLKPTGNGTYGGTYSGTRAGRAKLQGTMKGTQLAMSIRWPKNVNGDRDASMVLSQKTAKGFSLTVRDIVDGKRRITSRFEFKRL